MDISYGLYIFLLPKFLVKFLWIYLQRQQGRQIQVVSIKWPFLTTFRYISETTIKLTNVDCALLFPISGMGKHRDFKFDTWIKVDE